MPTLVAAVAIRRGRPQGPTNDHEIEDFIYDVFELVSGANEVDVRCEAGRVTLSGPVFHNGSSTILAKSPGRSLSSTTCKTT